MANLVVVGHLVQLDPQGAPDLGWDAFGGRHSGYGCDLVLPSCPDLAQETSIASRQVV
jgi:hypothetical protein